MNTLLLIAALQVCWVAPTQNVDGSILTDLAGYNIYYGAASRVYELVVPVTDPAALCADFTPAPGEHYVAMTALDADGNESAYSNEVLKTQIDTAPQSPVVIATARTAYLLQAAQAGNQPGRWILLPVGTVPAGTLCDPDVAVQLGNGLHGQVPNSDVIWTNTSPDTVRPVVVVALCGG